MTQDERNEEIRQNKGRSKGKGKKFDVVVSEKVKVSDSIAMEKNKEYVNQREFRKACKRRWGLRGKDADVRWQDLLSDVNVPKSKDQMGWTTMPVLHCFQRPVKKGFFVVIPRFVSVFALIAFDPENTCSMNPVHASAEAERDEEAAAHQGDRHTAASRRGSWGFA